MENDQVVRSVAAVAIAIVYAAHAVAIGNGAITTALPVVMSVHPFVLTVAAEVGLAFPEVIERTPLLPSRGE
jgi:hypothetical protein